ncbi:MAG: hypothetical protein AB1586_23235 [Pseudomonadota bacterium]|jgi:hypothetical protein
MSWSDRLPEPIVLASGACLRTLHDAKVYLMALPRPLDADKDRLLQDAIEALLRAGENEACLMHGHLGLMRVIGDMAVPSSGTSNPCASLSD